MSTRPGKYGRLLVKLIDFVVNTLPEDERSEYKARFLAELSTYSFQKRKVGYPRNQGCVKELEGMEDVNVRDPVQLAKLFKEGFHLMYQKDTSGHVVKAFLENIEK